jgi:hypothetical protein
MSIHNLLNNDNNLLSEKSLQFQSENTNIEPLPISDAKFGILKLTAVSVPMSQDVHEFIFMVDQSGSMSDMCSDGRDKMQHILHTLRNMIIYFKDNTAKVYVNIFAFDFTICEVVERTVINESNIDAIIAKIKTITPRGSTNIEKALLSIKDTVDKIRLDNPTHNISNIFMTDGEATAGSYDTSYLYELVDRNITNAFIGFGLQHDATLLNSISNGDKSDYYFIDKLENAGLVYGEILHGILYKVLTNVSIECSNCFIYDYKNNIWCNSLKISDITSESNKVFHVISSTPDDCNVVLKSESNQDGCLIQNGCSIFKEDSSCDLSKYVFRQRTLQLLYKINKFITKKNSQKNLGVFIGFERNMHHNNPSFIDEEAALKTELKEFMDEMKKYMTDNNLNDDGFMKNLCDDIYISYRTFDTKFGAMYNAARQSSQGAQRCYTVSHTPEEPFICHRPKLTRQINATLWESSLTSSPFDNLNNDDLTEDGNDMNHTVSNFEDTPYLTPTATQLMREMSNGNSTCDIFAQSKNKNSHDEEDNI